MHIIGKDSFVFWVQACSDAHLSLATIPGQFETLAYEVVIGEFVSYTDQGKCQKSSTLEIVVRQKPQKKKREKNIIIFLFSMCFHTCMICRHCAKNLDWSNCTQEGLALSFAVLVFLLLFHFCLFCGR